MKKHKSKIVLLTISLSLLFFTSCKKQKITKYYPNGNIKSEYIIRDGKANGMLKMFYLSGKIEYEVNIKNGLREGVEKSYYENGNLHFTGVCKNDKEQGWYYYYDKNQKLDSTIEYVLTKSESFFSSYMNDSIPDSEKESMSNRYLVYDKKGKLDKNNSLYFDVRIKKDTVSLGDTLFMAVVFLISKKHTTEDFKMVIYDPVIDKAIERSSNDTACFYNFRPNKKGENRIKGIVKVKEGNDFNYLLFNKQYFVR